MTSVYGLINSIDHRCNIESMVYDITTFCMTHDCEIMDLLQNATKNIFSITDKINKIAEVLVDGIPSLDSDHTATHAFTFMEDLGVNIGKLTRFFLGFDPSQF